jgi:hypothetical protein
VASSYLGLVLLAEAKPEEPSAFSATLHLKPDLANRSGELAVGAEATRRSEKMKRARDCAEFQFM